MKQLAVKCKWIAILLLSLRSGCTLCYTNTSQETSSLQTYASCPFGARAAGNGTCTCRMGNRHLAECSEDNRTVSLPFCYCMSYNEKYKQIVVGYCVVRCQVSAGSTERMGKFRYQVVSTTNNLSEINHDLCKGLQMNRTGQLCGECAKGFAPPVYSYSLACVNCTSNLAYNLLKYIAIAYLPLTAFYIFVVVFRLSVTSGKLNGYILTTQLVGAPAVIQFISRSIISNESNEYVTIKVTKLLTGFYGIFNLDFFRPLYPLFCIHSDMTQMQTLALDYAIAVYPLLLIFATYIFVSLHDRFSVIVQLWRPFYKCFIKIRKEWDIKASLIEVFATFILLSYVKILNTSLDLLTPTFVFNEDNHFVKQPYLRISGTVEYFGRDHLPYAVLALFMTITFNVLPMVLLFLYPCLCFQRCMNLCKIRRQTLHTFVEVFQGRFKTHPRNYRHFAAIYLLIRFINLALVSAVNGYCYFPIAGMIMFLSAVTIAAARPHRVTIHSFIDAIMFVCFGVAYISGTCSALILTVVPYYYKYSINAMVIVASSVHFLYGAGIIMFTILPTGKLKTVISKVFAIICKEIESRRRAAATSQMEFDQTDLPDSEFDEDVDENTTLIVIDMQSVRGT